MDPRFPKYYEVHTHQHLAMSFVCKQLSCAERMRTSITVGRSGDRHAELWKNVNSWDSLVLKVASVKRATSTMKVSCRK